ncbi:hypothetical protein ES703_87400 [subsurface metagenome]
MEYLHTRCGGLIDIKTRTCLKCKKHWGWLAFRFTLSEIRLVPATMAKNKPRALRIKPGTASYSKWGDRIPGVGAIASRLPSWPRWARILVTVAFILVVIGLVWWLIW